MKERTKKWQTKLATPAILTLCQEAQIILTASKIQVLTNKTKKLNQAIITVSTSIFVIFMSSTFIRIIWSLRHSQAKQIICRK